MKVPYFRHFVALCLGLACSSSAIADQVVIGPPDDGAGYKVPFDVEMRAGDRVWDLPIHELEGTDRRHFEWTYEDDVGGNGFRAVISGVLDPDPSIAWAVAVTDFGAPSTFSFVFTTPIVPTGNPSTVTGSISGGLTDATGNGISITPAAILGDPDGDTIAELQINEVGVGGPPVFTNMGVDVGSAVSFAPGLPGANYTFGPYAAGPIAGPAGVWTSLQSRISFTLSGNGDIASLTGFASIVPEPSSIALVAIGAMAVLGRVALRRRKV